ncbi:hypothetical protein L596_028856 [Steinernema carpocapsae]|uniref:Uncharacterized protein n=1 Tax=Steinernema carpocapsae TaxID=34508 RepID=A0A4V5ZY05_STECR|nr:hypothetical protein L596_028856 [Steinernema carpocapsae]
MQSVLPTTFRSLFTSFVTILPLLQFSISRADADSDLSNEVLEYNIHDHSKEQTYDIKVRGAFRRYKAFEEAKTELQTQTLDWCALGIKLLEEEIDKFWPEEENEEFQKLLSDSKCYDRKKKGLYAYERPDKGYQDMEKLDDKVGLRVLLNDAGALSSMAILLIVAAAVAVVLILGVILVYFIRNADCEDCCRGRPNRRPKCELEASKSVESTQDQTQIDAEVPRKPFKRPDFTEIGSCCCDGDWDAPTQLLEKSTLKACSETTELKLNSSWSTKKFPSRSSPTQRSEKSVTSQKRRAKKKKNSRRKGESMKSETTMSSQRSKKSTREASEAQRTEKRMSSVSVTA